MSRVRSVHIWHAYNQICSYGHAHNQSCPYLVCSHSNLCICAWHNQICSYLATSQSSLFIWACPQSDLFISCHLTIKSVHMDMFTIRSDHVWPSHNQICSYAHGHNRICSYLAALFFLEPPC